MANAAQSTLTLDVSPLSFDFQDHVVRVVLRDGEPWFVASDVCKALDYLNPSKAIADHLDEDERYNESLDRGGYQLLISESGLYALVLRSHKPQARKFAKWVTSEVLPSIRKTGGYRKRSEAATPSLLNRLFLHWFDEYGQEHVDLVPDEGFVTTFDQLEKRIRDTRDPMFTPEAVIQVAMACTVRMALTISDYQRVTGASVGGAH